MEVPEQWPWSSFRAYVQQERGLRPRERMERAEAEVCSTNSFPALRLRPGLETRETRGTHYKRAPLSK